MKINKNRIVLIHFQPLELYPPIMNFINSFNNDDYLKEGNLINIFSNFPPHKTHLFSSYFTIKRYFLPKINESRIFRIFKYLNFNLSVLVQLIKLKPKKIIYFETYSAWPVYWYLKFFEAELFIHNHEYFDKPWYKRSMVLTKINHKYEYKFLFRKAKWISHTNQDRIKLFLEDYPFIDPNVMKVIPNYPPHNWKEISKSSSIKSKKSKIEFVYIGSVSLYSTYLREFCYWIKDNKRKYNFSIYTLRLGEEEKRFLDEISSPNIKVFQNGINYYKIPEVLTKYDIGIIFYKAKLSKNFEFNAPNKLFEYLACGLDVWCSDEMIGVNDYITKETYPQVLKINYESLKDIEISSLIDRSRVKFKPASFYCEEIYDKICYQLMK